MQIFKKFDSSFTSNNFFLVISIPSWAVKIWRKNLAIGSLVNRINRGWGWLVIKVEKGEISS